jgi:type IV pilus assembly protein PilB
MHANTQDALEIILRNNQLMDVIDLKKAKLEASRFQQTLFQWLLQNQWVDAKELATACANYCHIPCCTDTNLSPIPLELCPLPHEFIRQHFILPIHCTAEKCIIAISDPNDRTIMNTLSFQLVLNIEIVFLPYDILLPHHNRMISHAIYHQHTTTAKMLSKQILTDAIHRYASDIHLETYEHGCRVRFRLDGMLHVIAQFDTTLADGVLSCLKVLAQLDIAIKRMPQDGRLTFRTPQGFHKDCRVSTCPTVFGEKMVIRLLDQGMDMRSIDELGLSDQQKNSLLRAIEKPQGLILVTGPTGSGKTITLYTLLMLLNKTHRNISTIEDPIEIHMAGINQTAVNAKTGLTFAHVLRALLRQDPDVIMIGEIRDQETAEMAIRAAQTGHLVLSTLHTNNSAEAITRLQHMGIKPFYLSAALTLIVAQRLVRKLCQYCRTLENKTVSANGCHHCTNGYQGRIGIFEVLPIDQTVQHLMLSHNAAMKILAHNHQKNHSLWDSAMLAVRNGQTTQEEIYRVIPMQQEMV